jgi:pyrroline-5-carboxylate reductase
MNITFIGGGNMAAALIGGLLQQGTARGHIRVVEIDAAVRQRLEREHGVATFSAVAAAAAALPGSDIILLAVKPQQMREAAQSLAPSLGEALVVSIAAGIRTPELARWLGDAHRIVRAMPNTPALLRAGVSGLFATAGASAEDRSRAEALLGAVGETVWFEREEQLDAVTAVSGSGPAYVFYFIEALEAAGRELGLAADQARTLALETFLGAAKLAHASRDEPAVLRARVTSKGGTTERAIAALDADRVQAAIVRAVRAAAERSRELGDELGAR